MTAVAPESVRQALRSGEELALLDVRPEARFAAGHPLFAASMSLDRLELDAVDRIPRKAVPIVVYGDDDYRAETAIGRLRNLGYPNVSALAGGLAAWMTGGGEVFQDVNAPSKAFGELVAERLGTPLLDPQTLLELIERREAVILDARRFDEFRTMSIPTAQSAPGATLVRQAAELGDDHRLLVVNCAGRTRSIIGAQSIINARGPGRVAALRNGTIGWTLAGLELDHGQTAVAGPVSRAALRRATAEAQRVATRAGVGRVVAGALDTLRAGERTVFCFDVRLPDEFAAGHLAGFRSAPGGQLVQETDRYAPVRGATVVLAADEGPEALMTASWLAQMGWRVFVLEGIEARDGGVAGEDRGARPPVPDIDWIGPEEAQAGWTAIDVGLYRSYVAGHLPGAKWASRTLVERAIEEHLPAAAGVVLTSDDDTLTALAVHDANTGSRPVVGLTGAWRAAGFSSERGEGTPLTRPEDRYIRPYEGTEVDPASMQAYLEWEYGLVEQLERDATHGFTVLAPDSSL